MNFESPAERVCSVFLRTARLYKTCVLLDRAAHVPLAGEQAGAGSVWSSETAGFCLQTLPQVPACFKTLCSPWNPVQISDQGQFYRCGLISSSAREFSCKIFIFPRLLLPSSSATAAPSRLLKRFLMFLVSASVLWSYRCHFRPCPGPRGPRLDWWSSFWRRGSSGPCSLWPPFAPWPNSTASKERWWTARSDVRLLCFMRCDCEEGFIQIASLSDRPSSSGGRSVRGDLRRSPPWPPGLLRSAARPGRQRQSLIHAAA